MDNIIVRLVEFPSKVRGATVLDTNGDYNVYINSNLSNDEQQNAYNHELKHIEKEHLWNDHKPAFLCEKEVKL